MIVFVFTIRWTTYSTAWNEHQLTFKGTTMATHKLFRRTIELGFRIGSKAIPEDQMEVLYSLGCFLPTWEADKLMIPYDVTFNVTGLTLHIHGHVDYNMVGDVDIRIPLDRANQYARFEFMTDGTAPDYEETAAREIFQKFNWLKVPTNETE
jgi:hypothetical protein